MLGEIAQYPVSSLFYILLVLVCVLLARAAEELDHSAPLVALTILLVVVSAFRGSHVGIDTGGYVSAYEGVTPSYFEPGFALFTEALKPLHATWLYLGCIAAVVYSLVFYRLWELRRYCSLAGAVSVFLLLYFPATWNGARSYLVTAIMFFALRYVTNGKYVRYFIALALSCTIHATAIVFLLPLCCLPFWARGFSRNKRTRLTLLVLVIPLVAFGALMFIESVPAFARYDVTYADASTASHIGLSWYLYFFIFALALFYLLHVTKQYCGHEGEGMLPLDKTFAFCCCSGVAFFLLGFFWFPGGRLSSYFLLYNILVLPRAWNISRQRRYGILFRLMVCTYCCYVFFQVLVSNGQGLLPYVLA